MDDLRQNYAAAFGGSLTPQGGAALLIVDVVRAYVDPQSPLYARGEAALTSNVRLVAEARRLGIPVIFTKVTYQKGGVDGGQFFRKVPSLALFVGDTPLGTICPELEVGDDLVVTKQYASAFFGTSLAATLNALEVGTVFVTGYSTSGCVRATAVDALQNGFVPVVVRDACADRHEGPHEANLFDLQAKYAEVVGEAQALALMSQLGGASPER